jgi:ribosomal protein S27AE
VLAKCANQTCSAPFRRLTEGKLFQVETQYPCKDDSIPRKNRLTHHVEHFWLCSECARLVTLAFHEDRGVMTVPLENGTVRRRVRSVELDRKPAGPDPADSGFDEEPAYAWDPR